MSLTQELIALIRAKPVTDQDLEKAAMFTLDALACAYAGSNTAVGEILQRWAAQGDMDSRRKALSMAALTHITTNVERHFAGLRGDVPHWCRRRTGTLPHLAQYRDLRSVRLSYGDRRIV